MFAYEIVDGREGIVYGWGSSVKRAKNSKVETDLWRITGAGGRIVTDDHKSYNCFVPGCFKFVPGTQRVTLL